LINDVVIRMVVLNRRPDLIIFTARIHLAVKPEDGGILLRLINIKTVIILLVTPFFSIDGFKDSSFINKITAVQYKMVNISRVTKLNWLALRVHLLLNTDDMAIISRVFLLFRISIEAIIAVVAMKAHRDTLTVVIMISRGIDFCHVIKIVDLISSIVLMICTNHR